MHYCRCTALCQVGNRCVVDLSAEEEPCCSAALHIAVSGMAQVRHYALPWCGFRQQGSSRTAAILTHQQVP
jgi:hypothetical protein